MKQTKIPKTTLPFYNQIVITILIPLPVPRCKGISPSLINVFIQLQVQDFGIFIFLQFHSDLSSMFISLWIELQRATTTTCHTLYLLEDGEKKISCSM